MSPTQSKLLECSAKYVSGATVESLALECCCGHQYVRQFMSDNGFHRKPGLPSLKRIDLPCKESVIARYVAGENEYDLAAECGVDRGVIKRWLLEAGITRRSTKETTTIRWQRLSPSERDAMVRAAHDATRGRVCSDEERVRNAMTRHANGSNTSPAETELLGFLTARGLTVSRQVAVGRYNLDLAIGSPAVAIECFGGGWHASGHHADVHVRRFRYLIENGWACVIVWHGAGHGDVTDQAAAYIQSFASDLLTDGVSSRQYRVIRGHGGIAPAVKSCMNSPEIVAAILDADTNRSPR